MCIYETAAFYAQFNIYAKKIVSISSNGKRYSQVRPCDRAVGKYYYTGKELQYDKNSYVESPDGPGIHVWFEEAPNIVGIGSWSIIIDVLIPCGAYVRYQYNEYYGKTILAASEVVVLT